MTRSIPLSKAGEKAGHTEVLVWGIWGMRSWKVGWRGETKGRRVNPPGHCYKQPGRFSASFCKLLRQGARESKAPPPAYFTPPLPPLSRPRLCPASILHSLDLCSKLLQTFSVFQLRNGNLPFPYGRVFFSFRCLGCEMGGNEHAVPFATRRAQWWGCVK